MCVVLSSSLLEVCQVDTAEPVMNLERLGGDSDGQISLYCPTVLKNCIVSVAWRLNPSAEAILFFLILMRFAKGLGCQTFFLFLCIIV